MKEYERIIMNSSCTHVQVHTTSYNCLATVDVPLTATSYLIQLTTIYPNLSQSNGSVCGSYKLSPLHH